MKHKTLALIGFGKWGKNLARNFYSLGVLDTIIDICEEKKIRNFTQYKDVKFSTNINSILDNKLITKVAIAAPAAQHYKLVKQALLSNKDVFVEKPLSLCPNEALELVNLAEKKKLILMVGHLMQYHPCIEKLKNLVSDKIIGDIYYISSNRLNFGRIRKEENVMWSFAPHDISVILSLLNNKLPNTVQAVGSSYVNKGIYDTTITTMNFDQNINAHIYVNWLNPFKEHKLTVIGSKGIIVFDDTKPWLEKLVLCRKQLEQSFNKIGNQHFETISVSESEPLTLECLHFIECCKKRLDPKTNGDEGLRVVTLLSSAQKSIENSGMTITPEIPINS